MTTERATGSLRPSSRNPAPSPMLRLDSIPNLPEVRAGDDLAALVGDGLERAEMDLADGDVLVVAQKVVSKAEGRTVDLTTVEPRPEAARLATEVDKDPRLIELVLRESTEVLRTVPGVIVVEHNLGLVMANAGIDQSNLRPGDDHGFALLLPEDPDASAAALRDALGTRFGVDLAVIVNDSVGRAWRLGTVGLAIGVAGMTALWDLRGERDLFGRELLVSETGIADQVASAAQIVQGEGAEGTPVVRVRGLRELGPPQTARALLRPRNPGPVPVSAVHGHCLALSGGVGGAKLALGLSRVLPPEDLTIVCNTADDFDHLGLRVCPDLDTVMYTLAGVANRVTGWGQAHETWSFLEAISQLGGETWFRLGDRDLATHVERTRRLSAGESLTVVTDALCGALGVEPRVLPMTDDPVRTVVGTPSGELSFQHYFVRDRCAPAVTGFRFDGGRGRAPGARFHGSARRQRDGQRRHLPVEPLRQRRSGAGVAGDRGGAARHAGAGDRGLTHRRRTSHQGAGGQDDGRTADAR